MVQSVSARSSAFELKKYMRWLPTTIELAVTVNGLAVRYLDGEKWDCLYLTHPLQVKWSDSSHTITLVHQHKMACFRVRDSCDFLPWRTAIFVILQTGVGHIAHTNAVPIIISSSAGKHEELPTVLALQTLLRECVFSSYRSVPSALSSGKIEPIAVVRSPSTNAHPVAQAVQADGLYHTVPAASFDEVDVIEVKTVSAYCTDFESQSSAAQRAQLAFLSSSIVVDTARFLLSTQFVPKTAQTWLALKNKALSAADIASPHSWNACDIFAALNAHPRTSRERGNSQYFAIIVALTQRSTIDRVVIECETELLKIGLYHAALEHFDEDYMDGCAQHLIQVGRWTRDRPLHIDEQKCVLRTYLRDVASSSSKVGDEIDSSVWGGHETLRNACKLFRTCIFVIMDTVDKVLLVVYEPCHVHTLETKSSVRVHVSTRIVEATEWFTLLASEVSATSLPIVVHCDVRQQYSALLYQIAHIDHR